VDPRRRAGGDMSARRRDRLASVCALLNAERARYVLVGGYAVALHGVVRATKDIDILIEPTLENARRTLAALKRLTFGVAGEVDPADLIARPLTIIGDTPRVHVLTLAFSVRYADAKPGQRSTTLDGVRIPYVDLDTLIRSKQTGRPQDVADIAALERIRELQGSAKRRR
jgi:hypothetical protein